MAKSRLLVKVRGNGKAFAKTAAAAFGASAVEIEPILEMPSRKADEALGLAAAAKATSKPFLLLSPVPTAVPPWASWLIRGRVPRTRSMP